MYFSKLREPWSFQQGKPVLCRGGFGAENRPLQQGERPSIGFSRKLFSGATGFDRRTRRHSRPLETSNRALAP